MTQIKKMLSTMLRIDSPDPDPDPTLTQVNWQDTDPLKMIRIRNAGSADQDLHIVKSGALAS
jgi:hypothetical protein